MSASSLQGQRIWLTGATGGLGQALARQLAAQGATLLLSGRSAAALAALAASLPGQHQWLAFDLLDLQQGPALADLQARLQPHLQQGLSQVIFNAGQSQRSYVVETLLAVEQQLLWVNFLAPALLTRIVLPDFIAAGQGQLVYLSSMAGRLGSPGRAGYSAAKHALTGWVDSLRQEVQGRGVRVRLVSPDFIQTGIAQNALNGQGQAYAKLDAEIQHGQSPEQMAARILSALAGRRQDIRLCTWKVRTADWVYRLNPELYHWLLPKFYRRNF